MQNCPWSNPWLKAKSNYDSVNTNGFTPFDNGRFERCQSLQQSTRIFNTCTESICIYKCNVSNPENDLIT